MSYEKEKRIKEQRTIEATQKGFMGFSGRFGMILKYLGQPIIDQHTGVYSELISYHTTPMIDFYDMKPEENGIPTMDVRNMFGEAIQEPDSEEWSKNTSPRVNSFTNQIGWHFDALRQGVHLEIKFIEEDANLTVYFKGEIVYKEIAGELHMFLPNEAWENPINSFYRTAKLLDDTHRKIEKKERIEQAKINKENWLNKLRKTWGF